MTASFTMPARDAFTVASAVMTLVASSIAAARDLAAVLVVVGSQQVALHLENPE